jgi:uncharacterized membrane protein YidH (DUF202 family)
MTLSEEDRDVMRRTRLANERTLLAWWRAGLTAAAAGLAAGAIVPSLGEADPRWAYAALGAGFGLMGVVCAGYGAARYRAVDRALRTSESPSPNPRLVLVLTTAVGLLALATVTLVLARV